MIKADFLNTAWVVIPATGVGVRAGMNLPKQYVKINHQTILDYTIQIFKKLGFKNILVILHSNDNFFKKTDVEVCVGGASRYDSVREGLNFLDKKNIAPESWILIHDAVRPCLDQQDLTKLINVILDTDNAPGGILTKPVTHTLKYTENNFITHTISRKNLYEALTPQIFKFELLKKSFNNIKNLSELEQDNITDEAYLIEKIGLNPLFVTADFPNPKFTYEQDLDYIKFLLEKNKC